MKNGTPPHKLMGLSASVLPLIPLFWLLWQALNGGLGANPIEKTLQVTGDWTLNFLLITLALSPLAKITGRKWPVSIRRSVGLYAFFYASLHLATYVALDQFFSWEAISDDMIKNKRIIVGVATYSILITLAVTSSKGWARRLGPDRWRRMHRLVYLAAGGGVAHYLLLVKKDLRTPLIYAAILAILMALRVILRGSSASKKKRAGKLESSAH